MASKAEAIKMKKYSNVGFLRSQQDRIDNPSPEAYLGVNLPGEGLYVVLRESELKKIASIAFEAGVEVGGMSSYYIGLKKILFIENLFKDV